jgi:ferredoxin
LEPGSPHANGREAEPATYNVEFLFPDGPVTVEVRADEFILAAARRQGLDLPSLCEMGWCCTCSCKVLEGYVDQSASRRFYEADREAGFALICTGQPRSDLRLRPYALEEMRAFRIARHLPVPRGTKVRLPTR